MKNQFLFLLLLSCAVTTKPMESLQKLMQGQTGNAVIAGSALLLLRPLLGALMQNISQDEIEKFNVWELISVSTGRDHNDLLKTGFNIGGLRFKVTMLDQKSIKDTGIISAGAAVKNVTDPALARAIVEQLREVARLRTDEQARAEIEDQKNQWALNVQGNLLNIGVQTRIPLSDMVLTGTGLAFLIGMQNIAQIFSQSAE